MTSTPLTIFPGQVGGGVSAVWPSTRTRAGAESASPGQEISASPASRQAKAAAKAARTRLAGFSALTCALLEPRCSTGVAAGMLPSPPGECTLPAALHDPGQSASAL